MTNGFKSMINDNEMPIANKKIGISKFKAFSNEF